MNNKDSSKTDQEELNETVNNEREEFVGGDNMIKNELIKTLSKFFNELDLVFDYIDRGVVKQLDKFLESLDDIHIMKKFVQETVLVLSKYETDIFHITNSKLKLKTVDFNFLNDIVLFDNLLNFSNFKNENKNTKTSIVKYLYNIYMSTRILQFGFNDDIDALTEQLTDFVKNMEDKLVEESQVQETNQGHSRNRRNQRHMNRNNISRSQVPNLMGNFGNIMESLMQNGDIMNLANDLSKDIQDQNIDPMMLLTSLMSGRPDTRIQNLVSNISEKIESKITNGEIDKTLLEQQAQNILDSVNESGDFNQIFKSLD